MEVRLVNYFLFKVDICIPAFQFRSLAFLFILHIGSNFNLINILSYFNSNLVIYIYIYIYILVIIIFNFMLFLYIFICLIVKIFVKRYG